MKIWAKAAVMAVAVAASMALAGCATNYGAMTLTGGYKDTELEPGVWRVGFYGNGYTSVETVQSYWLYHAAQLAQDKGYDGFETVKHLKFSSTDAFDRANIVRVRGGGGGGHSSGGHSGGHYVGGVYTVYTGPHPYMVQDIRLLRKPFAPVAGRSFNATELKAALEPYVNGKKCNGNVCPHVHSYLYPVAGGDKPSAS